MAWQQRGGRGGYGGSYGGAGGYRGVPPARSPAPRPVGRAPAATPRPPPPRTGPQTGAYSPIASTVARPTGRLDSAYLYNQQERHVTDICHLYPRLALPNDFLKLTAHWTTNSASQDIPLTTTIPFLTNPEFTIPVPEGVAEPSEDEPRIVARVMLLTMAKPEEPTEEEKKKALPPPHPSRLIKFLVAKRASGGLMSIGGAWNKTDGADPNSDATLIKTAIRHCKEICGVDLSPCKQWLKFIEIHYRRPNGRQDRTVFFIPDVWNHLNSGEVKVYKQVQQQETEVTEEVEVEVAVEGSETGEIKKVKKSVATKKLVENVLVRSMDLSLNGILEYDQADKHEETVELSLFAEAFEELLSLKSAQSVVEILLKKKAEYDVKMEELKRKRDVESEEREAKRKKAEEERKADMERRKKQEQEEKHMTEEQVQERRQKEAEERKAKQEEEKKKREKEEKERAEAAAKKAKEDSEKKTKTVTTTHSTVHQEVLEPFLFFDKPVGTPPVPSGQLRRERVESILYSLGTLSRREIDGLLQGVNLPKDRPYASLYYKVLATTTTTTTEEVPIEEAPKEEPKAEDTVMTPAETTAEATTIEDGEA